MQPQLYPTDWANIAYIISLLSRRALQWANSIWEASGPVTNSLTAFTNHFKKVFSQIASTLSVHDQLFSLHQGKLFLLQIMPSVSHFGSSEWLEWKHLSQLTVKDLIPTFVNKWPFMMMSLAWKSLFSSDALHRMTISGEDFILGAGGIHCWCHPGMPLDAATLTNHVLEQQRNPEMGRFLLWKLLKTCQETSHQKHLNLFRTCLP